MKQTSGSGRASPWLGVRGFACGLLLAGPCIPAIAQESKPPTEDVRTPTPPDDATERLRRRTDAGEEPLKPADGKQAKPAPAIRKREPESSIPVPIARRAREGVFIIKQRGELMVARTGDVIFIPDKDAPTRISRPMVLLPNQALARLESAAALRPEATGADSSIRTHAVLSGQITVYRQREYLLTNAFQVELDEPNHVLEPAPRSEESKAATQPTQPAETQPAQPEADKPGPAQAEPNEPTRDRDVETLIRELEDRRTQNRSLTRESANNTPLPTPTNPPQSGNSPVGSPPAAPQDSNANPSPAPVPGAKPQVERVWPLPEGSVITARRCRLVHLSDGAVGVSFDNGAHTVAGARRTEAPMALLPCQIVQRMEEVVGNRGDRAPLEISGRVFTYSGRNYLLPTMYQVLPPSDVGPLD